MPATTIHEVWVKEIEDSSGEDRIHFALRLDFKNDRHYNCGIPDGSTAKHIARVLRELAAMLEHDPSLR